MNPLKKVAIFVDWENIRIGVFGEAAKTHQKKVGYNQVDNITKFINAFIDQQSEEIYRIFFYLADPYGGEWLMRSPNGLVISNSTLGFFLSISPKRYSIDRMTLKLSSDMTPNAMRASSANFPTTGNTFPKSKLLALPGYTV